MIDDEVMRVVCSHSSFVVVLLFFAVPTSSFSAMYYNVLFCSFLIYYYL